MGWAIFYLPFLLSEVENQKYSPQSKRTTYQMEVAYFQTMNLQHNILWPSPPTQHINYLTSLPSSTPHSILASPAPPSPVPTASTQQRNPIKATPSDNSLHLNSVAWQPWAVHMRLRKLAPHSYPLCVNMSNHTQIALNLPGTRGHIPKDKDLATKAELYSWTRDNWEIEIVHNSSVISNM